MVSLVGTRPNHYEALGLTPAASDEDIRRAFVGKMSVFGTHPIAEAGQILVAYETLREPGRRKAYDDSLGLNAKPELREWSFSVAPPRWAPFIATAPGDEKGEAAPSEPPPPEPHVAAEPHRPAPVPRPSPQAARPRQPENDADLDIVIRNVRAVGRAEKDRLHRASPGPPNWKRVAMSLGGLVVGAGLIGTLAGISVKDNVDPAQAEPVDTVERPATKQHERIVAPSAAPAAAPMQAAFDGQIRAVPVSRSRHSTRPTGAWADQMAESLSWETAPAGGTPVESTAAEPADDAQPARTVAADLPLSNAVVARTIERIGYACGQVASTEGEGQGAYKITCSSGETYRAARVGGRYHFRRLGGR